MELRRVVITGIGAITPIRLAILTFLRDNRLIRVNRRTAQNFTRIYKYIDDVVRDEGYEPDI